MKNLASIALTVFALFVAQGCFALATNGQNRLTINLDEKFVQQDQQAYLFCIQENQIWIVDSLFLPKNQTTFSFNNVNYSNHPLALGNEKTLLVDFTKAQIGNLSMRTLDSVFDITITLDDKQLKYFSGTGGRSNYKGFEFDRIKRSANLTLEDSVTQLRRQRVPESRIGEILDSANKANKKIREQFYLECMESQYPETAYFGVYMLERFLGYTKERLEPYTQKMKERFPDNLAIQLYPEHPKYASPTDESRAVGGFWNNIRNPQPQPITTVKSYKIGDTIPELSVTDSTGKLISIKDIKTPYILIDFWASWCSPCRQESPYLKEALAKYKDSLTIYAISVDKDRDKWLAAIKEDQTEMFTHLFLPGLAEKAEAVTDKFGVSAIPANFLLDKDRKIIAENLRENALSEKLLELTK